MNLKKHVSCLLMALLCILSLSVSSLTPAYAASQSDIDDLKHEETKLEQNKKALDTKLNKLAGDKSKTLERREYLDKQASITQEEIKNVEKQISQYETLIVQTESELADAESKEADQYELFCKRVRAMEEESNLNYWSVLFRATSFTDFLTRMDIVKEIMEADQRVIDDLKEMQANIKGQKVDLENSKADSEAAKAKLLSKKQNLEVQRTEAIELMKSINSSQKEYQGIYDDLEAEEEQIQRRIVDLSRKLAKEQAAANGGQPSNAALGGYIWPVSSRRITSPYGPRPSPGGVGSKFHKGIDIGQVGYTTEVHAAKAGTVTVSQYSSSYGNYVVVSHGSGNTTLYAHMSSRSVSVGQYVNQGDVLGITGSTGRSTGPHLHFEITENGKRIDPAKYLKA